MEGEGCHRHLTRWSFLSGLELLSRRPHELILQQLELLRHSKGMIPNTRTVIDCTGPRDDGVSLHLQWCGVGAGLEREVVSIGRVGGPRVGRQPEHTGALRAGVTHGGQGAKERGGTSVLEVMAILSESTRRVNTSLPR